MTNILLKRLAQKGLVKAQKLDWNRTRFPTHSAFTDRPLSSMSSKVQAGGLAARHDCARAGPAAASPSSSRKRQQVRILISSSCGTVTHHWQKSRCSRQPLLRHLLRGRNQKPQRRLRATPRRPSQTYGRRRRPGAGRCRAPGRGPRNPLLFGTRQTPLRAPPSCGRGGGTPAPGRP